MDKIITDEKNIVSEEVYEEINSKPPWIVRNGLLSMFMLLAIFLSTTFFVKYPEDISVPVKITISGKTFSFSYRDSGLSDSIFLKSGQRVDTGAILVRIGNSIQGNVYSPIEGDFFLVYDYVHSLTKLYVLSDTVKYAIWANVTVADIKKILIGQKLEIHINNSGTDKIVSGSIKSISPYPVNNNYAVKIFVDSLQFRQQNVFFEGNIYNCEGNIEISNTSILHRIFRQLFHLK